MPLWAGVLLLAALASPSRAAPECRYRFYKPFKLLFGYVRSETRPLPEPLCARMGFLRRDFDAMLPAAAALAESEAGARVVNALLADAARLLEGGSAAEELYRSLAPWLPER